MSFIVILILVLIAIIVVCGAVIFSLSFVIREKDMKIKLQFQDIKALEHELMQANTKIMAANHIQKIVAEGKNHEDIITDNPNGTYNPNGMFNRFKPSGS